MNSFYGGKQGLTYNIVERFSSVQEMVQAFNNGGAYSRVNYGQYVLIDTIIKDRNYINDENGLLFRRGFDYSKEYVPYDGEISWQEWLQNGVGGGAIYVGQISGPMGQTPTIEVKAADEMSGGTTVSSDSIFVPATSASISDQFKIKYNNSTVQVGQNHGVDRLAQIGLRIPYPTISMSATTVSPHNVNVNELIKSSDDSNELYQNLTLSVPKGYDGDSVELNINNIQKQPNKTTFQMQITTIKDKQDSTETEIKNVELESESVDRLKLIGDFLYYHTHYNTDYDSNTSVRIQQGDEEKVWNRLGAPSGQFHIYTYFSSSTKEDSLRALKLRYPYGIDRLIDENDLSKGYKIGPHAGWLVGIKYTPEGEEEEITELYAFDYTVDPSSIVPSEQGLSTIPWFKVADFATALISPNTVVIVDTQDSPSTPSDHDYAVNLVNNGIWLVKKDLADSESWNILNKG